MRVHVGCGAVLLNDFLNVDLPLPHVFLATERPDLAERFRTDESNYYSRHADKDANSLRGGPVTGETCCDVYGSFTFLPARTATVSELLAVQVFEHLDRSEAGRAIDECARVLKPGGLLRLDIPDPDETIRQYRATGDEFFLRHLFGPRKNLYGFHTHYTREMLTALVETRGFRFVEEEGKGLHFYPAYMLRFVRK